MICISVIIIVDDIERETESSAWIADIPSVFSHLGDHMHTHCSQILRRESREMAVVRVNVRLPLIGSATGNRQFEGKG